MKKQAAKMPLAVKHGPCCLCIDKEKKRVWTIESPAISGDVCDGHMEVLVQQTNGKKEEAPLFDNARA